MNKILKTLMALLILFVLTGCGAKVSQELVINDDGSGERIIYAYLDNETISEISGGVDAVTKILKENLPEPLTLDIDKDADGSTCQYTLKYSFKDLDDYNAKTAAITGKEHVASIVGDENPFASTETFSEDDVFEALISWGLDAFEKAQLTTQTRDNFYEHNGFTVDFKNQKKNISSYDRSVSMSVGEIVPVDHVTINVDFINNQYIIAIKMLSNQFDLLNKSNLDSYFDGATFSKDDAYSLYTYSFPNYSSYHEFLVNRIAMDSRYEVLSDSPINKKYFIREQYDVRDLFPETDLSGNVDYTIALKNIYDADIYSNGHYIENDNKNNLYYAFNNRINLEIDYEKSLYANQTVTELLLDSNQTASKTITAKFPQEELAEFDFQVIKEYYEEMGYNVVLEEEDEPSLTFTTDYAIDSSYSDMSSITSFYKAASSNFKKNKIHFVETFNYSNLMPSDESVYVVKVNKKLSPTYVQVNGKVYTDQDIKDSLLSDHYEFIVGNTGTTSQVKIICENTNLTYQLLIVLLLLLVVGVAIIAYMRLNGKKSSSEDQDNMLSEEPKVQE